MKYLKRFERYLTVRLGGLEMANEFFALHPECIRLMRRSALFHRSKGGAAWKGAAIFMDYNVKPILAIDRKAACATRIPPMLSLDEYLDPRM